MNSSVPAIPKRRRRVRRLRLMLARVTRLLEQKDPATTPAIAIQTLQAERLALEWVLGIVDPQPEN